MTPIKIYQTKYRSSKSGKRTQSIVRSSSYTLDGTLEGFSTVTIASGGSIDISSSTLNSNVTNNGTFTWSGNSASSLFSSTSAVITNHATLNNNADNVSTTNVQVIFVNENGGTVTVASTPAFQRLITGIAISEAMVELAKTENRPDDEAHAHFETCT